jgi:SAM-dependent methyltransferase
MTKANETIRTYDNNAELFAARFATVGPRTQTVNFACNYLTGEAANMNTTVEAGCSAGRDAVVLSQLFTRYHGFDPSAGLIHIAKQQVSPTHPNTQFSISDAVSYAYPRDTDAVFAFASLHHLDQTDLGMALGHIRARLTPGGILLATLRESKTYEKVIMEGEHGEQGQRIFYYYPCDLMKKLAVTAGLHVVYLDHPDDPHPNIPGATLRWFRMILRKEY